MRRIDLLVECCAEHIETCKAYVRGAKFPRFRDGVLFGNGISRQLLCKQCNHCKDFIYMSTTSKIEMPDCPKAKSLVVSKLVFGAMDAGMGFADTSRLFSTVGLELMDEKTFYRTTEMWGDLLWEFWGIKRKAAYMKAIMRAEAADDVDEEGAALLSGTADGGWFTRCNRGHTFSSKTGVQVIRCLETGDVLEASVKNSYCAFCHYHSKRNPDTAIPVHTCYQNYKGPATGMEQQGIVEGFLAGYHDFGCKISVLVADGDSSTFPTLVAQCPWLIKKCHCSNHFHKCCRNRLEKAILSKAFTDLKWHLVFPSALIVKLCKSIKAACRMARVTPDKVVAERNLRHDLPNTVWHVLGFHEECRVEFCETARTLRPDEPVPEQPSFRLDPSQIGKLGTCVKAFLEAKWEEPGESLDSCTCNADGVCVCDFSFSDSENEEEMEDEIVHEE